MRRLVAGSENHAWQKFRVPGFELQRTQFQSKCLRGEIILEVLSRDTSTSRPDCKPPLPIRYPVVPACALLLLRTFSLG